MLPFWQASYIFFDAPQQVWFQLFWNIELQNSHLTDINVNGDINENKFKKTGGDI